MSVKDIEDFKNEVLNDSRVFEKLLNDLLMVPSFPDGWHTEFIKDLLERKTLNLSEKQIKRLIGYQKYFKHELFNSDPEEKRSYDQSKPEENKPEENKVQTKLKMKWKKRLAILKREFQDANNLQYIDGDNMNRWRKYYRRERLNFFDIRNQIY